MPEGLIAVQIGDANLALIKRAVATCNQDPQKNDKYTVEDFIAIAAIAQARIIVENSDP